MTPRRLLAASLLLYWRTNLAVIGGVVIAVAVIGGALIVGDSVRDSLTRMSLDRLGGVAHALTGGRFFREDLVSELSPPAAAADLMLAPAITLAGTLTHQLADTKTLRRAGGVQVYAVGERFWSLTHSGDLPFPRQGEVVLSARAAAALGIPRNTRRPSPGDEDQAVNVSLLAEIPASIPRDSLLGDRNELIVEIPLTVAAVAGDDTTQGRFGLNPTQQLPLNAFVSLHTVQSPLGVAAVRRSRQTPQAKPARINAIFAGRAGSAREPSTAEGPGAAADLTQAISATRTLADLSLRITINKPHGYVSLESDQMILDDALAGAAQRAADSLSLPSSPVFVYLINEIASDTTPENYSMYPVVAGIEFADQPPFGPFDYLAVPEGPLAAGDIVINEWLAEDLRARRGDQVNVRYYRAGDRGDLPEEHQTFRVAGIVRLAGLADDPGYTPLVPGITDVKSFGDWRQPFPLELNRVTRRDDEYWDPGDPEQPARRATPKIFMPLAAAQQLWASRYGRLTSFRVAPPEGRNLNETARDFETALLHALTPRQGGFVFQPVRAQGLAAAQGTTDFTGLFIGFSFFLIAAAALLINLVFRLGIERRASEMGLLSAVGMSPRGIMRLFLAEGLVLAAIGGLLGVVAAIGYARLMIHGLTTWWIGAIGTRFLELSVRPLSLLTGLAVAALIAVIAMGWALRQMRTLSARELLAGLCESEQSGAQQVRRGRFAQALAISTGGLATALAVAGIAGLLPRGEAFSGFAWNVVAFFVVGVSALTASLAFLAWRLNTDRAGAIRGRGAPALAGLGLRNAARNRRRSLLTAGLMASATFVIVAVAAGHRNPAIETPDRNSGNGGYTLVAESAVPLLFDLNTLQGRAKLGVDAGGESQQPLLQSLHVAPFRMRPGEDASCLNLYRTQLPTLLGVPSDVLATFAREHRFRFANTPSDAPWRLLEQELPGGNIPVLGDLNTLQYSLHLGLGDTIDVPQTGARLEVVGMFDSSIFQGVLVMTEEHFHRLFPEQSGFLYFLIEVDPHSADALATLLETELTDYGFDVDRIADRLADLLAVQNTYLSTFATLGGLGLLLGTIGLGVVMLRNVLERRAELALLRAVGFRASGVAAVVFVENAFLLAWGLGAGAASAMLAMAPHLVSTGADVPWSELISILVVVVVVGMLAGVVAVAQAVRSPIVATLRGA